MSGGYALAAEVSRPEGGRPCSRLGCVRDAPPVHPASSRQPRQAGLMAPLLVLLGGWLLLRTAGRVGVELLSSWRSAGRGATAGMFMFTGATHFSPMKHDYAAMIPEPLPRDLRLIHLTGLLQIAGAVGLLIPPLRRVAGIGLAAQLVAMFPANAYAARQGIPFRGRPPTPLALRAPVQLALIAAVWWTAIADGPRTGGRARKRPIPGRPRRGRRGRDRLRR
jgi:uncharacterized membrane protein